MWYDASICALSASETGASVMKFGILGAGFLAVAAFLATNANASVNLITNGSFETGDFTGWTTGANSFPQYSCHP